MAFVMDRDSPLSPTPLLRESPERCARHPECSRPFKHGGHCKLLTARTKSVKLPVTAEEKVALEASERHPLISALRAASARTILTADDVDTVVNVQGWELRTRRLRSGSLCRLILHPTGLRFDSILGVKRHLGLSPPLETTTTKLAKTAAAPHSDVAAAKRQAAGRSAPSVNVLLTVSAADGASPARARLSLQPMARTVVAARAPKAHPSSAELCVGKRVGEPLPSTSRMVVARVVETGVVAMDVSEAGSDVRPPHHSSLCRAPSRLMSPQPVRKPTGKGDAESVGDCSLMWAGYGPGPVQGSGGSSSTGQSSAGPAPTLKKPVRKRREAGTLLCGRCRRPPVVSIPAIPAESTPAESMVADTTAAESKPADTTAAESTVVGSNAADSTTAGSTAAGSTFGKIGGGGGSSSSGSGGELTQRKKGVHDEAGRWRADLLGEAVLAREASVQEAQATGESAGEAAGDAAGGSPATTAQLPTPTPPSSTELSPAPRSWHSAECAAERASLARAACIPCTYACMCMQ